MSHSNDPEKRRRSVPLLWLSGAMAAALLVLGVNGTLSSWTTAIIHNDTNTTSATDAVALSEADGVGTVCVDTGTVGDGSNTATCSTINKYGGTTTPLSPGGAGNATTVTLKNTGSATGNLTLTASGCTKSAGISGATDNICDYVNLTVECPTPTSTYSGTLTAFASAGAQTVASLAAGASVACTFTVSLPANAPADIATQVASQPLTWTLTKA
jgi:hypothetical protein